MTGPAPFGLNVPDEYEQQLVKWGQSKIASGADPDVVNSMIQDRVHAYRASMATRPEKLGPETPGERAAGAISSAYQGMTLGAGNKITAGIRTVMPQALGGTKGFDFPEALKEQTQVQKDYDERHPVWSRTLEMAGSALPIAATGGIGAIAPEASAAQRTLQLAKAGAGYGGISGAASANSWGDVIPGAAKGAAFGAVAAPAIGAVAGPVARGIATVARKVAPNAMSELASRFGQSVGTGPVTPEEKAQDLLRGSLDRGGVEMKGAVRNIPAESPTTMLDLGSQPTLKLARQARNVPTSTAGQTLDTFLKERATGAGQRVESALTSGTGATPTDVELPIEDLIARRSEEAKPLYQAAYGHGEIQNPETVKQIQTLLQNPTFAKSWKRGQALVELEHGPSQNPFGISDDRWRELQQLGLDRFVPGVKKSANPTVQQIDAWKKGLDATIESGFGSKNALSRSEARLYRQKLNDVLEMVDQEVPAYAQARHSFRGNSELMEAADAGKNHFSPSVSADYLQRTLPELSDGEQEAYRTNAINAAVAKLRTLAANPDLPDAARGTNIVQRLMGTSDAGQKVRMLFPDDASYQAFIQKMEQEAQYPATNRFLTQQSSTAAQLAESGGGPSSGLLRDAGAAAIGSPYGKMRLAGRAVQSVMGRPGIPPAVADQIARQGIQTGPALEAAIRQMSENSASRLSARARLAALFGLPVASLPSNP